MCVTMGAMKATIRRIGNSKGIILPKPLISQLNLGTEVELTVEEDAIIVRNPKKHPRQGWAQAASHLAEIDDHHLIWPEFANRGDSKLRW